MTETSCDSRALRVARALHERERPQATILFGSRARGDYEDNRSDIDIMLIRPDEPDGEYKLAAADWAEDAALETYGRRIPVQLVWFSQDEFREKTRYVNHVATRALLDGVVMSQNPEDYRSRYSDGEGAEYEYDWSDYEERLRHAEDHLRAFQRLDDLRETDLLVAQQAHAALEHGMKAVIAAHGGTYRRTHNLGVLLGTLRRIDPELADFRLDISPDLYSAYAGEDEYRRERSQSLLTEQPGYRELTQSAAQRLINRAREVRQAQG